MVNTIGAENIYFTRPQMEAMLLKSTTNKNRAMEIVHIVSLLNQIRDSFGFTPIDIVRLLEKGKLLFQKMDLTDEAEQFLKDFPEFKEMVSIW